MINFGITQIIAGIAQDMVYSQQFTGTTLTSTKLGKKNEFLFFQQALCQAPIYSIKDVIFDESKYLNDPALGTDLYKKNSSDLEAALRVDCYYSGNISDNIISINCPERTRAVFDGMSYIGVTVRIDRVNPQFQGVPVVQALIEGKKIHGISRSGAPGSYTYDLTAISYSNNPALVLLDYLLDNPSGKSLSLDQIELSTFYDAMNLCDIIVQTDVVTAGKIWRPTTGTQTLTRDLPLYECNIVLDPQKTIRENVESILSTMGDARLVWSQGRYKLSLQYPDSNSGGARPIDLAMTLTDEELVLDQEVSIAWPSASERLNHCIIKFSNEAEDFKEDSVSWPPKLNINIANYTTEPAKEEKMYVGLGGYRYPFGSSAKGWDDVKQGGKLLNNFSVWNGNDFNTALTYQFVIEKEWAGATCAIEATGDDSFDYTLSVWNEDTDSWDVVVSDSDSNRNQVFTKIVDFEAYKNEAFTGFPAPRDRIYKFDITAQDTSDETDKDNGSKTKSRGVAIRILNGNAIIWSTREPAYQAFSLRSYDSTLYKQFLTEDNGMEYENEIFAEGITDYYHALAKAEELVRSSRGSFSLSLKYNLKDKILEPGDFIQVQSETLKLGLVTPLYFRVNSVKVTDNFIADVSLTRFDWTFLAWNMKDDEYVKPPLAYDSFVPAPAWLLYSPTIETTQYMSSGRLDWPDVNYYDFATYAIFVFTDTGALDVNDVPIFVELGRTVNNHYILPNINSDYAIFGIRTVSNSGKFSEMIFSNVTYSDDSTIDVTAVKLHRPSQSEDIIKDPFFLLDHNPTDNHPLIVGTDIPGNKYWRWKADDPDIEIVPTGGVEGGFLRLTGSSYPDQQRIVYEKQTPPYRAVTGDKIELTVRFRITSAVDSNTKLYFAGHCVPKIWPFDGYIEYIGLQNIIGIFDRTLYPWSKYSWEDFALDEWHTIHQVVTVENNNPLMEQNPYVNFYITTYDHTQGIIEIDTFRATHGATAGGVDYPAVPTGQQVLFDDGTWGDIPTSSSSTIGAYPSLVLRDSQAVNNTKFGKLFKISKNGKVIVAAGDSQTYINIYHGPNFMHEVRVDIVHPADALIPCLVASLAISDNGENIIVGCPYADNLYLGDGIVFLVEADTITDPLLFTWNVDTLTNNLEINANVTLNDNYEMGTVVAISGDGQVGAFCGPETTNMAIACFPVSNNTPYGMYGMRRLIPDHEGVSRIYGRSLAISYNGDFIAIGGEATNSPRVGEGLVAVAFGPNWHECNTILCPNLELNAGANASFGVSAAFAKNNRLVIGNPLEDVNDDYGAQNIGSGAIYVFETISWADVFVDPSDLYNTRITNYYGGENFGNTFSIDEDANKIYSAGGNDGQAQNSYPVLKRRGIFEYSGLNWKDKKLFYYNDYYDQDSTINGWTCDVSGTAGILCIDSVDDSTKGTSQGSLLVLDIYENSISKLLLKLSTIQTISDSSDTIISFGEPYGNL